jgi:hypothetical protein
MRTMTLAIFASIIAIQLLASPWANAAGKYVYIDDVSRLKYQMSADGVVYLRNLSDFDSSVTGCCYAFSLDTTTGYGKSLWALILMKMASASSLYVYVTESNPPTSGNPASFAQAGNW